MQAYALPLSFRLVMDFISSKAGRDTKHTLCWFKTMIFYHFFTLLLVCHKCNGKSDIRDVILILLNAINIRLIL